MKKVTDTVQFRHGATVLNRIVMPPMLTFSGEKDGFASDDTIQYYNARSSAAGLLIVEYHYVSKSGGPCGPTTFPEQLGIYDDAHIPSIKAIADALKKDGNKAILQIHHGGREARGRHERGEDVLAVGGVGVGRGLVCRCHAHENDDDAEGGATVERRAVENPCQR